MTIKTRPSTELFGPVCNKNDLNQAEFTDAYDAYTFFNKHIRVRATAW